MTISNIQLSYFAQAEDTTIAGVKVRVYRPNGCPADNNAAIVFYHGGGWVLGNVGKFIMSLHL